MFLLTQEVCDQLYPNITSGVYTGGSSKLFLFETPLEFVGETEYFYCPREGGIYKLT